MESLVIQYSATNGTDNAHDFKEKSSLSVDTYAFVICILIYFLDKCANESMYKIFDEIILAHRLFSPLPIHGASIVVRLILQKYHKYIHKSVNLYLKDLNDVQLNFILTNRFSCTLLHVYTLNIYLQCRRVR